MEKKIYLEKWYLVLITVGLILGGSNIMLIPQLMVHKMADGRNYVPLIMGIMSGGGIIGPLWGKYSEKFKIERPVVLISLVVFIITEMAFPFLTNLGSWIFFVTIQAIFVPAILTNATLFVVLRFPSLEWDRRTNNVWLVYSVGTVIGLMGSSLFAGSKSGYGIIASAILVVLVFIWALFTLPNMKKVKLNKPTKPLNNSKGEQKSSAISIYIFSAFGLATLSWFFVNLGSNVFFFAYPLVMAHVYFIPATYSGLIIGGAALIALSWYPIISKWSEIYGPYKVFAWSVFIRLFAFLLLVIAAYMIPAITWVAIIAIAMVFAYRQTWPFMLTASTILAEKLSIGNKGLAMGLFAAVLGISGVFGGIIGSVVITYWGFKPLALVSGIIILTGYIGIIFLKNLATPYLSKDIELHRSKLKSKT